jgi:hypothetical protein
MMPIVRKTRLRRNRDWETRIGPWAGYHFTGAATQHACEASIIARRSGGTTINGGIVCFPSFHVIWAILAAVALWRVKGLRTAASVAAALVVASTVTTG